jgi:hypothetical protein
MEPHDFSLSQPGPVRDLWARAAVQERFRAGDLLGEWIEINHQADKETVRTAKRAVLELQRVAKPALGADGLPAHRLSTDHRLAVLRAIGPETARQVLAYTPAADRSEIEALLADLLFGDPAVSDAQNRPRLVALSQAGLMAAAAGAPAQVNTEAVRRQLNALDFLNLLGGPDLHRFVGRANELARLHQAWNSGEFGAALVTAPGGMGKSMLMSRFVADLLDAPKARPTAVFHIDFDRRDMQTARPANIVSEMLRQAPRWVGPDRQDAARTLAATAHRDFGEDYQGHSRSLESSGVLVDHRIDGLIDLFDTGGDFRVVILVDSAEQVFGFDDTAAESPAIVADYLSTAILNLGRERRTQVMVVWSARYFPTYWIRQQRVLLEVVLDVLSHNEARAYLRAEVARAHTVASGEVLDEVIKAVGRSPLALRLAARLLAGEDARANPGNWVDAIRNDPERIQAILHDRVLKRIRNPDLRKLALPGLLLRRLTPAIVERVLAGPCKLDLTRTSPSQLIAESAREGQLFFRDESDYDTSAVWHRPDVRALMLPNLDATIESGMAAAINMAAVRYYEVHDDEVSRAEELYHRLRLDQPSSELTPRWTQAAGARIRRALDELPPHASAFVRDRLGAASLAEINGVLDDTEAYVLPADTQRLAELRRVIRRELQRGSSPLEILVRYNVDTLDDVLGDTYAEALVASGQFTKLLAGARDMLARDGVAPPDIRAAVFATAAGVLEGQGKLSEALAYWTEVRSLTRDPESREGALMEGGGVVGLLRTERKLGLVEENEAELERLAIWAEEHASELVSQPVLLRELIAEIGGMISKPDRPGIKTCHRLLRVLFETEEAFPSAVADPQRLGILSEQLGLGPARSARMLCDMAAKAIYIGDDYSQRVIRLIREEVEWTLVNALSRSLPLV